MPEYSAVEGSWVHSEIESSRVQKDFICREEKRKVAWGHAAGPETVVRLEMGFL
jgi:hypothetical protein